MAINDELLLVDGWYAALAQADDHKIGALPPDSAQSGTDSVPFLRKRRPDVAAALGIATTDLIGFVGCMRASSASQGKLGFLDSAGGKWRIHVPTTESRADATNFLKGSVASVDLVSQVRAHVAPVVAHDAKHAPAPVAETIYQWPDGLSAASLNVVVPIYRNFDYLRNQLFALTQTSRSDQAITLVCDDPTITKCLLAWVRNFNAIYRLPLKLVAHDVNAGFAAACNTGAGAIDSDVTLLLNSDVLPALEPADWARRLTEPLEAGAAMTAPVLLFPDGSVQHAGMIMAPSHDFVGFDLPTHRWKGMLRTVLPEQPYAVPLLSGAALAIRTSTFHDLGGMPTWLGKGDFEDVALSVSARKRGGLIIVPSVAWTHVEAASYDRSSESDVLMTLAKSQLFSATQGASGPAVSR